jgi:hypothetical protein
VYALLGPQRCPAAARVAAQACRTLPVGGTIGDNDRIARHKVRDTVTNFLNNAGTFVTK